MRRVDIRQKLEEIECPVSGISLGDFDTMGEFTAKKERSASDPLYRRVGRFFRPNYERGILVYHLVKRFEVKRFLEVGFGRGYVSFCAAKAMHDMGWREGKVWSVDPVLDEQHLKNLTQVFPKEWFSHLNLLKGTIDGALQALGPEVSFDMVYVDGDHRADAVRHDWESVRNRFTRFVLFDNYNEEKAGIEVKGVIDAIEGYEKELVVMDRRMFLDDRGVPDASIDYGQVLVKHPSLDISQFLSDW